jgi:hypothetical protein
MYLNIGQGAPAPNTNIGGFASVFYWSSSEVGDFFALYKQFAYGYTTNNGYKDFGNFVRAIRAF